MAASTLDFRNTNCLWCSVIAETLARLGLRHAVVSPGSRSTPLTFAFAGHPQIEAIPVLDERSAAFFALGTRPAASPPDRARLHVRHRRGQFSARHHRGAGKRRAAARVHRRPSAGAARVRLRARPSTSRSFTAIHVNFYHELAVPEAKVELLRYVAPDRSCMPSSARCFPSPGRCTSTRRSAIRCRRWRTAGRRELRRRIDAAQFFAHVAAPRPAAAARVIFDPPTDARGLIMAGPAQPADPAAYLRGGGPAVLGAGLAGAGGRAFARCAITPRSIRCSSQLQRRCCVRPALAARLRPDAVLCLGEWPTSKQLRQWLQAGDARRVAGEPTTRRTMMRCMGARATCVAPSRHWWCRGATGRRRPGGLCARLAARRPGGPSGLRLLGFRPSTFFSRARPAGCSRSSLPPATPLFIASSMPVRDVEFFWEAGDRAARPFFNRGANGIDGTLSTALGVAHGNRPAVLLPATSRCCTTRTASCCGPSCAAA